MTRGATLAVYALLLSACTAGRRLTAPVGEYATYREVRSAKTTELRLAAADTYLKSYPEGAWSVEVGAWFEPAEASYFEASYDSLPRLRRYVEALPDGPHAPSARARIRELEQARRLELARQAAFESRVQELAQELEDADQARRRVLAEVTQTIGLVAGVRARAGVLELGAEPLFRWTILPPRVRCRGGRCTKAHSFDYVIPAAGVLEPRRAIFDVELELELGAVRRVVLTGPELWSRVAEAVTIRAVAPDDLLARLDAIAVALVVVENAIERALPTARCAVEAVSPVVLARQCDGVRLEMLGGRDVSEEDRIVLTPAPP